MLRYGVTLQLPKDDEKITTYMYCHNIYADHFCPGRIGIW